MMETEELVDTLESAGLSPYQAAAYVATLELGVGSATEIAEASDVPAPRVYDVLDALAERGYVETYEQDTLQARAHSAADVLADLRGRAERLEAAAAEVEERWEQPELDRNRASIVKRFGTVLDRARLFIEEATSQVHLAVTPAHFAELRDALADAHERGVAVDVLVHTAVDGDPPDASTFEGACREARHRPLPTPFVALVDRRMACFAHHPDAVDRYGVLVDDEDHTFVFHWYFRTCLWEHAVGVHSARSPEPPIEYVDIRRFVREARPLFESDAAVTVRVVGTEPATGESREFTGRVVGARSERGAVTGAWEPEVAGQVSVLVETDDGVVTVGGWEAVVEDVEATRIVVEDVTGADGVVPAPFADED